MTGLIFINYRRDDDPGFAGRLYDKLAAVYPAEQLFMDVDNIPAGRNFVRILDEKVRACDVLLAVVGRNWLDARDDKGRRRLDSPKDFVRIEIESALKAGKQIVPVLAYGARMPAADALPESLEEFALTNAVAVSHERFGADFQALLEALKGAFAQVELDRKVAEEAAAKAAAEAARKEEQRLVAEKARLETKERNPGGLTKAEIAKAEELANWDFIKQRNSVKELRDHLRRFPDGTTSRYAKAALDEIVWGELPQDASAKALKAYLKEFPSGAHAPGARERMAALEREAAESAERSAREAPEKQARITNEAGQRMEAQARHAIDDPLWKQVKSVDTNASSRVHLFDIETPVRERKAEGRTDEPRGLPTCRHFLIGAGTAVAGAVAGGWWYLRPPRPIVIYNGSPIGAVAFSPDGTRILTGSWDKTARLWDAASGAPLRTLEGHTGSVSVVAFSPDGTRLLTGSWDNTARLWDAASGAQVKTLDGHTGRVSAVAFSPDGTRILTGSEDKTARTWVV